ncbi:MAG: ATP synthase I [Candidatus Eisenbacteria bacterium]|nr:ATP synthase I [Candidatus Eisenbacteria bacterium]
MGPSPQDRFRSARVIGLLTMIPLVLAVAPLLGYGIGSVLDRWLHTGQVLRLVFLGLGFVAGGREVVRIARRAQEESDRA